MKLFQPSRKSQGSLLLEYLFGFVLGGVCLFLVGQLLAPFWASRSPRLLEVTCPETGAAIWAREIPCAFSAQRFHALEAIWLRDFSSAHGLWTGASGFPAHSEKPSLPALAWGEPPPLLDPARLRFPPFDSAVQSYQSTPEGLRALTVTGYRGLLAVSILQVRQWDQEGDRVTLYGYWQEGKLVKQMAFYGSSAQSPLLGMPLYTADPYHRAHWDEVRDFLEVDLPQPTFSISENEELMGTRRHVFYLQP